MVVRVLSGVFRGEEYLILSMASFCMAMFVKFVWMCELECWGMVLRSSVYSIVLAGYSFDATCSWLVRQHVVAWVVWICTGCG